MTIEENIINGLVVILEARLKALRFNSKLEGLITEVVDTNTYKVRIQNNIETIKSMNNDTYLLNDVVYVMVFNDNYSDKRILCKK